MAQSGHSLRLGLLWSSWVFTDIWGRPCPCAAHVAWVSLTVITRPWQSWAFIAALGFIYPNPPIFTFPIIQLWADLPSFWRLPKPPLPFPPLPKIQSPFRTWLFLWPLFLETTLHPTSQGWVCRCLPLSVRVCWEGTIFLHIVWLPNTETLIIIRFCKTRATSYLPILFFSTCQ